MNKLTLSAKGLVEHLMASRNQVLKGANNLVAVMGNEAADLDSIVSAMVYSYYKQASTQKPYYPLININKIDFKLRPDAELLLVELCKATQTLDVTQLKSSLLFLDDSDPLKLHKKGSLKGAVLVDHNRLAANQSELADLVEEIVDHHSDESHNLRNVKHKRIATVGSACSLVADIIFSNNFQVDPAISAMLLAPILLDTILFNKEAKRYEPIDIEMANKLTSICLHDNNMQDIQQYQVDHYKKYFDARRDISSLSSEDLLRKDYKEATVQKMKFGIASVPCSIATWIAQKADSELLTFATHLRSFYNAQSLDVLAVMTIYEDDAKQVRRELITLIETSTDNRKTIASTLQRHLQSSTLQLSSLTLPYNEINTDQYMLHMYEQGDTAQSRKKVLPLINNFLAKF